MIEGYLTGRPNLVGVLHLVDARHEPTKDDQVMSIWLREMDMPSVLIATKADKISRSRYQKHVKMIREALQREPVLFSAQTKQGRDEVLRIICELGGLI
jgi:GTP-binding protein